MATSSNFSTTNQYIKYRIIVIENSISVANNTSNVTVKVQCWRTNTGYETYGTGTCYVTIDGIQYTQAITTSQKFTYNSYTEIFSKTLNIAHNSNGSKTLYVSSYISHSRFDSNSQGFNVNLTNIPRGATITNAPNFTDTGNPTITYSNSAGNQVTSLQACISLTGSNDDIAYRDISKTGTTYTFNLTTAERNTLLNATSGKTRTVYFYIKTVLAGNTIYTNKAVTFSVVNANPTIGSIAYQDINSTITSITENNQWIVRNKSTLQITLNNLQALKGATLSSAVVNINGNPKSFSGISGTSISSVSLNYGVLNISSNINATITLTDSRGFVSTYTKEIIVLDYQEPYSTITLARLNNFYTQCNLLVDCTYSSLNNKNSITIQWQSKKVSDSSYGSLTTIQNNTSTTIQLDNQYQWNVRIVTTDALGTSVSYVLYVDKGIPIVFFDKDKNSVGINCFPREDESLEVGGLIVNGVVLAENTKETANVKLIDSASNYKYLEIYYCDNDNTYNSVKVENPNGKNVLLSIQYPYQNGVTYIKSCLISISGQQITSINYSSITIRGGQAPTIANSNYCYIRKVIGY